MEGTQAKDDAMAALTGNLKIIDLIDISAKQMQFYFVSLAPNK